MTKNIFNYKKRSLLNNTKGCLDETEAKKKKDHERQTLQDGCVKLRQF